MAKYLDEAGAEQLNQLLAAKFDTKVDKAISTKTYTNILGVANDTTWGNNTFYFASVKPTSFTDIWSIRYRIYVWVESDSNYRAMANVLFMGSQSGLASYAIFNNIYNTSYRPAYYHTMYRLLQAGFNAGYGHAIGVSLKDANAKDTTGKERTIKVELLEQINCTTTLLNNAIKWDSWEGANATNYSGFGSAPPSYNFSGNGLQETGDANDNSVAWTIKSYYDKMKAGSGKVYRYNICTYCNDNTLQSFVTSASTGTTKTKNTASYMIGAPLFYFNSSSDVAAGSVCADNTLWTQHSGIDLRYSTNCGATLTQYLPVYLVGIPNGATYTLADTWYTQTLPTSEDGKIYIFLGIAYNSNKYTISWTTFHPIYEYKNGILRLYQAPVTSSDVTSALGYTPYSAANPNGYTSNTGTITKVQANGTDVASSGTANIPAATTSKYGVTELSSATNSTSEALAATPKAVKAAYDLAASKGTGTITGVSVNGTSVATSGVANITSVPASILSGAIPSAVTATTQTQGDNSTKIATTAYVDAAIDNLPDPMIFKGSLGTGGTITALPVDGSANIGDTYKVITAGTYASKAAKVGDTFICLTKTSSANTWELIPSGDEPAGTVTSVTIKATSPISIDSSAAITSSGTRTLSHANSGVTAGNYKSVTVNATGHVTAGENPTTLAGYGITDAKIANGVITLGSNTITPITDISGKVNISGDTMTGTLTTPNLIAGNLKSGTTLGTKSNILGKDGIASGNYSVAEGNNCQAKDEACHAEGYNTIAGSGNNGGDFSHAEGCETKATGFCSHSEGYYTTASESYTHAEGKTTEATGYCSHTEGSGTKANRAFAHVQGVYNVIDTTGSSETRGTYAHIIGNGTSSSARKNIHTVAWTGEAWFQGDVYVGSTGGTNKDSGSKKLATENYVTTRGYVTTDTKNTAGSTDSSSKLFLIGATSQAANPQTYSQDTAYVGTDGKLYSNSKEVVNLSDTQALTNKTYNGYTLAAACAKAVVTSVDTSASLPTSGAVKTFVEGKGYVTTDTKNTAGSTDTSSKIYLIGATSQAANPQTYSDNEVYVTSGAMTAKSYSLGTYATMEYNSTDNCIEFNFS